jgi:hypothetical protein
VKGFLWEIAGMVTVLLAVFLALMVFRAWKLLGRLPPRMRQRPS